MTDHPSTQPGAGLLPCPFCGGESKLVSSTSSTVQCQNDQCIIGDPAPFNDFSHRADAIAAWNTRAPSSLAVDRKKVAEEINDAFKDAYNEHGAQGYGRDTPAMKAVTSALSELEARVTAALAQPSASSGEGGMRERAAKVAEDFTRTGRDWVPNSLWDNLTKGIAAAIRALPSTPSGEGA